MLSHIGNAHRSVDRPVDLSPEAQTRRQQTLRLCEIATYLASAPAFTHKKNLPSLNDAQLKMLELISNDYPLPASAPEIQLAQAEDDTFLKLNMLQSVHDVVVRKKFSSAEAESYASRIQVERQRLQPFKERFKLAEKSLNEFWKTQSPSVQEAAVKKFEATQKVLKDIQKSFPAEFNQLLVNAVRKGHLENIPVLVESGARVDLTNKIGWNLTSVADREGKSEAAKLLEALGGQNDFNPQAILNFARDMAEAKADDSARVAALKTLLPQTPSTNAPKKPRKRKFSETV